MLRYAGMVAARNARTSSAKAMVSASTRSNISQSLVLELGSDLSRVVVARPAVEVAPRQHEGTKASVRGAGILLALRAAALASLIDDPGRFVREGLDLLGGDRPGRHGGVVHRDQFLRRHHPLIRRPDIATLRYVLELRLGDLAKGLGEASVGGNALDCRDPFEVVVRRLAGHRHSGLVASVSVPW